MGGQGRVIGGLALSLLGVLGVCVTCGLPMWRETSFVGANIVTAQSVWDGLWLHCVVQSTGQMQCKRHKTAITLTSDIQGGRVLVVVAVIAGFLGFVVALGGGGAVNCGGGPPHPYEPPPSSVTKKKVCLLGGCLCLLSCVLCLISVTWSAGATLSFSNDPFVPDAMKREVGSSVYIGWASSVLLLLGGVLLCFVCGKEEEEEKEKARPRAPSYYYYSPYDSSHSTSRMATTRSNLLRPNTPSVANYPAQRATVEHMAQVYRQNT